MFPEEATCIIPPMAAKSAAPRRPGLRPHLSLQGLARRAPAKAPACMTETMLAERLASASLAPSLPSFV
jgi:hypothetical protein